MTMVRWWSRLSTQSPSIGIYARLAKEFLLGFLVSNGEEHKRDVQLKAGAFQVNMEAELYAVEAHEFDKDNGVLSLVAEVAITPMFNLA
jgi:hypothetical protein